MKLVAPCPNPGRIPLEPGDVMLYSPSDVVGLLIALKTWTWLSHVEVYIGQGKAISARPQGVNVFGERIDKHLVCVRRPLIMEPFNKENAWKAVSPMLGMSYEWTAFESFFNPWCKHRHASRICSSVVTVYLRGGGCEPFNPDMSADDVSPAQLWQTSGLITIWEKNRNPSLAGQ